MILRWLRAVLPEFREKLSPTQKPCLEMPRSWSCMWGEHVCDTYLSGAGHVRSLVPNKQPLHEICQILDTVLSALLLSSHLCFSVSPGGRCYDLYFTDEAPAAPKELSNDPHLFCWWRVESGWQPTPSICISCVYPFSFSWNTVRRNGI